MSHLLDRKLKHHIRQYLFQSLLAGALVLVVLLLLDALRQTAIIASLGASVFIVFAAPTSYSAKPRSLLGGYVIGAGCGLAAAGILSAVSNPCGDWTVLGAGAGAVSVAASIFLMTVLDMEHPPAAGIALGFVLNEWDILTVLVVFAAIAILTLVRVFLGKHLLDLV